MQLQKIKLENIRSYSRQELVFPDGTILLSGNIGTGKSSILLAIDFALFGLRKGGLSGTALLKNGERKGRVELHFSIAEKDIVIHRVLKRSATSVVQDSGYISVNNIKKEATPVELKEAVLQLLNYPRDFLTKSKSLIYEYTVYTPQEGMKQILLGNQDSRLDILRRVFGIDKYKHIKENTKFFLTKIREKMKEFAGFISDLEEKKIELGSKRKRNNQLNEDIKIAQSNLEQAKTGLEEKRKSLDEIEKRINEQNLLKMNLEVNQTNIKNKKDRQDLNSEQLKNIYTQINELEVWLNENKIGFDAKELEEKYLALKKQINSYEIELKNANKTLNELEFKKRNSKDVIKSILDLSTCPTCKQEVCTTHKEAIISIEDKNIKDASNESVLFTNKIIQYETQLKELHRNLDTVRENKNRHELINLKKSNLNECINRRDSITVMQKELEHEINEIDIEIKNNLFALNNFNEFDNKYITAKKELDAVLDKIRMTEVRKAEFDGELKILSDTISILDKDVVKKDEVKSSLLELSKIQHWLEEYFLNLVDLMEKQVMLKVHADFDSFFQKWFSTLIDDERLIIKLDDTFSPIIEQDGYDIDYLHLSGGEKTAAALAYRLALNQVINALMSSIKTNDLLILDEPTDGFSEQQLDKVRDVLQELAIKQVILVSHESKIESFVEHVIRFEKIEGVSKINTIT